MIDDVIRKREQKNLLQHLEEEPENYELGWENNIGIAHAYIVLV